MLRKLNETYEYSLLRFLERDPEINLFIIGDLENFGFNKDFQEIWAEYNDEGEYIAVLLRYRTHFIFYSISEDCDFNGFSKIIESYLEASDISGNEFSIKKLSTYIKYKKVKEQHFAKLTTKTNLQDYKLGNGVVKAKVTDAEGIYTLRQSIREFQDFKTTLEGTKESLSDNSGRTCFIKSSDKVIAAASTTAESKKAAMVVSVMTHPDFRKTGYATSCVSVLCEELLSEGKSLCLFYNNPSAGSIYKKLGFEDIGMWTSLFL